MDRGPDTAAFVSTGSLPRAEHVQTLVAEAHERFRLNAEGARSQVYPALARVPAELFGVCVAATNGSVLAAGDADVQFTIMSVATPFVFALVCESEGPQRARERLGVNCTGLPFDSLAAIERSADGRTNPMVNAGAIATTSLVGGSTVEQRWQLLGDGLSRFAGHTLSLDDEVYESASATNHRNRASLGSSRASAGSTATPWRRSSSTPGRAA
ncbi:MAG TPA: glutaminase [Gaiellaceae bacterium]|nr:glutaminase [Gaiellaceae bacterium]